MKSPVYLSLLLILISFNAVGQSKKAAVKPAPKKTTKTVTKPVKPTEPSFIMVKIKSSKFYHDFVGDAVARNGIEDKIDEQLEITKNGEWISGDTGPGEANILLKVKNIELATKTILKVLNEEKFDKTIFIGLRTSAAKVPWTYKVIYPKNYKGNNPF